MTETENTEAENTEAENTETENTETENTETENTEAENTENTEAENTEAENTETENTETENTETENTETENTETENTEAENTETENTETENTETENTEAENTESENTETENTETENTETENTETCIWCSEEEEQNDGPPDSADVSDVHHSVPALEERCFVGDVLQVLLSGAYIDASRGTLHVADRELASMRKLEVLEVLCEDVLPRSLSEIRRLSAQLSVRRGPLRMEDFERTVLTMVFTAQQLQHTHPGHQRELWANALLQLYQAIKEDLRPHSTGN
ncbi:hypothetical protein PO909_028527 [Leuciscus waleckii]